MKHKKSRLVKKKLKKGKKRVSRQKLNKNLKHVAKILSKAAAATDDKSQLGESSSTSSGACSSLGSSEDDNDKGSNGSAKSLNWRAFVKVRERSFGYLQSLIRDNWNQNSSVKLTSDEILDLSLMVEQRALLACMQTDIYQRAMSDTISSIREASDSRHLHPQLEKFIVSIWERHKGSEVKLEPSSSINAIETSKPPQKPTVMPPSCINRITDDKLVPDNVHANDSEAGMPIPVITSSLATPVSHTNKISDSQLGMHIPIIPSTLTDSVVDINNRQFSQENLDERSRLFRNPSPERPDRFDSARADIDRYNMGFSKEDKPGEMDDVTSTTNDNLAGENDYAEGNIDHDAEIDNLMRILEGDDDTDRCDLDTRLQQMQNLFSDVPKEKTNFSHTVRYGKLFSDDLTGKRGPQVWAVERYIFMYRIVAEMSRMGAQWHNRVKTSFLELFGPDSDNENEDQFCDYEKFTANCVRRILPTVARYLMPYYKQHRICHGSFVFKNLVRKVSQCLIDQNYYPNDSEIRSFVVKFFPNEQMRYLTVGDVWSFVLDDY